MKAIWKPRRRALATCSDASRGSSARGAVFSRDRRMELIVAANGKTGGCEARWGERLVRAAMGPAGPASAKREGDGTSPSGRFPFRYLMYRPDRLRPVPTG